MRTKRLPPKIEASSRHFLRFGRRSDIVEPFRQPSVIPPSRPPNFFFESQRMASLRPTKVMTLIAASALLLGFRSAQGTAESPPTEFANQFTTSARPIVGKYCLGCHSTKLKKGSLDLERFVSAADAHKDLKAWQQVIEMIDAGEMPPKDRPQPTAAEKTALTGWARRFLDEEARFAPAIRDLFRSAG